MIFCFSLSKEIKVTDPKNGTRIVLSKDTIKSLYGDLALKGIVVRKLIRAHVIVLKYGLKTGNERVIVIDGRTRRIEADETGTPEREDMQEVIYDGDEYAYPKVGESDAAYEARMAELRKKRNARMTDEERSLVADTLKAFAEFEPTLSV